MIFSKKYKYRSLNKKKTSKFYFFNNFFCFLFQSEFLAIIFQKKSDLIDFRINRNEIMQKGFIFKKLSSTFFRRFISKYKPFFNGFSCLNFGFHFLCYCNNKNNIFNMISLFEIKEMKEKYEIIFINYKGRFYSYIFFLKIYNNLKIKNVNILILFKNTMSYFLIFKNMYLLLYISKYKMN